LHFWMNLRLLRGLRQLEEGGIGARVLLCELFDWIGTCAAS
jgi:hypothetical protein